MPNTSPNDNIKLLIAIKNKYKSNFLPFYLILNESLSISVKTATLPSIQKIVPPLIKSNEETILSIKTIIGSIDEMLNSSSNSKTFINKIKVAMVQIEKNLKFYVDQFKVENIEYGDFKGYFGGILNDIYENTGVSLDSLFKFQKVMSGRFGTLVENIAFKPKWQDNSVVSDLKEFGATLGKATLASVAGPYGRIAYSIWNTFNKGAQKRKENQKTLEQMAFTEALSSEEDVSSPFYGGNFNYQKGTDFKEKNHHSNTSSNSKAKASDSNFTKGFTPGVNTSRFGESNGRNESLGDSLATFYSGPALKVAWTRRVLEALETIAGKKSPSSNNGGLGSFILGFGLKALIPLLMGLGTAILWISGVISAALAGWGVGKLINKYIPIWANPTTLISKGLGSLVGTMESPQAEGIPIIQRQMELINSGMGVHEAAVQARKEFEVQKVDNKTKGVPIISSITNSFSNGKVVTSPVSSTINQSHKEDQNKLQTVFEKLVDIFKDQKKATITTSSPSGTESYSIKDPLISGLSFGGLDID